MGSAAPSYQKLGTVPPTTLRCESVIWSRVQMAWGTTGRGTSRHKFQSWCHKYIALRIAAQKKKIPLLEDTRVQLNYILVAYHTRTQLRGRPEIRAEVPGSESGHR